MRPAAAHPAPPADGGAAGEPVPNEGPAETVAGLADAVAFDPSFALPPALEAHEPPEARGLARDGVRMLVSSLADNAVVHAMFRQLPAFLAPGDVLVVNTSATINAALPAARADGESVTVHLSQRLAGDRWVVELRRHDRDRKTAPLLDARPGERLALPAGAALELLVGHARPDAARRAPAGGTRLWVGRLALPGGATAWRRYLDRHGSPIRYGYVPRRWPLACYQTLFAREPGSAEMPSAGRPFTPPVRDALLARGVVIAPVLLHTGVASLEAHEPPYAERFRVPAETARVVNEARQRDRRVVAVGTTVVRALETAAAGDGTVAPRAGWTELVVTPERGLRVVTGLLTGFHEPRASHLAMLAALAGRRPLELAYAAALAAGYLWHEFGDVHLILAGDHRE